jgi:hypothetical protein
MFSTIELIGHLSQALFTVASGFRKLLYLRLVLIIAAVLEIIYYLFVSDKPMWSPIVWSAILIALNAGQILRVAYEKRFLNFSANELKMYELIGRKLDRLHFKKIVKNGGWINNQMAQQILQEDCYNDKLYFLVDGEATITIDTKTVSHIHKGNFIGEMSFLTGEKTSASVSVSDNAILIYWEVAALQAMLEKDNILKHEFYSLLSTDVVFKIIKSNKRLVTV